MVILQVSHLKVVKKMSQSCQKLIKNFVVWPRSDAPDCNDIKSAMNQQKTFRTGDLTGSRTNQLKEQGLIALYLLSSDTTY